MKAYTTSLNPLQASKMGLHYYEAIEVAGRGIASMAKIEAADAYEAAEAFAESFNRFQYALGAYHNNGEGQLALLEEYGEFKMPSPGTSAYREALEAALEDNSSVEEAARQVPGNYELPRRLSFWSHDGEVRRLVASDRADLEGDYAPSDVQIFCITGGA